MMKKNVGKRFKQLAVAAILVVESASMTEVARAESDCAVMCAKIEANGLYYFDYVDDPPGVCQGFAMCMPYGIVPKCDEGSITKKFKGECFLDEPEDPVSPLK